MIVVHDGRENMIIWHDSGGLDGREHDSSA
jgi:hypothetical protein